MAQPVGKFWKVADLVSLFMQMGCELRTTTRVIVHNHEGQRVEQVRFLFNPETEGFLPLEEDLSDDEFIPQSEVENWERRLGIGVPRPTTVH